MHATGFLFFYVKFIVREEKLFLARRRFLQILLFLRYDSDSPELLWRKLGDLAFLVQNYELAYNSYHTAKRDFNTNHAWLYFAGALVSDVAISVWYKAASFLGISFP